MRSPNVNAAVAQSYGSSLEGAPFASAAGDGSFEMPPNSLCNGATEEEALLMAERRRLRALTSSEGNAVNPPVFEIAHGAGRYPVGERGVNRHRRRLQRSAANDDACSGEASVTATLETSTRS